MAFEKAEITSDAECNNKSKKFDWYWAIVFSAVWFSLYYVAVINSYYSYPKTILIRDERHHPEKFIGERAQHQLLSLSSIGVKLSGTTANEVDTVNFLLNEIEKVRQAARNDLYDIDVDVQYSSGKFMLWGMATSYHNVSNVMVKITSKKSTSESYLLVNSHYDSEVDSPAAADAGVMIVIMLETLRVISRSEQPLRHPIVFLFNGAEESNMLAAHGFITQHRWAKNCKALINLDSAGSGGREILFQSGPNHPWLMKYYQKSVPHPFASTMAEELFENNFIPSDTDFRIFRDYGKVPGLDMAHTLNGYIYHTKFDNFGNLERGTYQTTGDNVLALTRALANADELENPDAHAEGHTVFYDFLGWFLIFYKESTGVIINITTCVIAFICIALSVFMMTKRKSSDSPKNILKRFLAIFGVHIVSVALAFGVTLLVAVIMSLIGSTESWYSHEWFIFGLYFCPMVFVMGILPAFYIYFTKMKSNMSLNDTITCFMHSHCILLAVICIILTALKIRSAFFPMIAVFFYTVSVILNILARVSFKKNYFLPIHFVCQLLPFWFYTYLTYAFLTTFIPMQGRDGPGNPDYLIAGFMALMVLHFGGFLIPIFNKFRKTKSLLLIFGIMPIIFAIIAVTPAGFPFKKDVAVQRFYTLHTNRMFYGYNGSILNEESGIYVQPVDSRATTLDESVFKNALDKSWISESCESEIFCGLPLYNSRWMDWKESARWMPAHRPHIPTPTELRLTSKTYLSASTIRYGFSLRAADRIVIYVAPYGDGEIVDWSFDTTILQEQKYHAPYFVYHMYSMDDSPLEFWIVVNRSHETDEGPALRLGVGTHFLYHSHAYTAEFRDFLKTFPDWAYPINWIATYTSWQF